VPGFDIDDYAVVGIDQIVGGIGEEGIPLVRARPLGRRIRSGNELRRDRGGRAERRVVERREIFACGARGALWKPGSRSGARRRECYEDQSARISILAGRRPPKPDTLKQIDQALISTNPLQTGRAIRS
jgi:hypothetical protein